MTDTIQRHQLQFGKYTKVYYTAAFEEAAQLFTRHILNADDERVKALFNMSRLNYVLYHNGRAVEGKKAIAEYLQTSRWLPERKQKKEEVTG